MITKWWWRFREGSRQLWAQVVHSIYGPQKGGKLIPVKNTILGWWTDIGSIEGSLAKRGIKIKDKLKVRLGNGKSVLFWKDDWTSKAL
ncbi:hypothetical protein Hanom_Chr04g00381671 [Helianthus anomalus]